MFRLWGRGSHKRKSSVSLLSSVVMADLAAGDGPILEPRERQQLHPRFWMVLGVSFVCIGARNGEGRGSTTQAGSGRVFWRHACRRLRRLPLPPLSPCRTPCPGLLNVIVAALWHFWLGVAMGFGVAKMGTSLCGMTLAARPPPPPARGLFGWAKNLGRRALMWGASKMQQLFYVSRHGSYVVAAAPACSGRLRCWGRPCEQPPLFTRASPAPLQLQFFRWAIYLYGLVVLLQLIIHLASPDYRWAGFPAG